MSSDTIGMGSSSSNQKLWTGQNCAEYNFLGAKVQRNSKVKCSKCPIVYNSTDAFKYQECYRSVIPTANPDNTTYQLRISFVETTSRTTNSSTPHDKSEYLVQNQVLDDKKNKSYKHIYFGGFCVVIIVIFVALAKKTICDKRRQEKDNTMKV
uniref:Uncharacterized protein LOC111102435 isoform X2 n=1 Tax=Crassostrea virginica TaxID=6565 RepID=A0A8B8ALG3_CRAVI|nr:uncharacterized protein LOC111102435 isoform X2 [Crassostrea virginica]XP_022290890.1 uncharacterized protein LOC111102435 isoform X2 [Crassostrea virginica]